MIYPINHLPDKIPIGIQTEGDHTLELSPKTSVGIEHNVKTRILIKTVEK